ncbi:hypothetical protein JZ751_027189 [Albula glossodonta]|uniref:Uncharacterized protein n=1 Tax=Albula glossodonta TaxID=121402 RepID=A0A8T2NE00_9TELE|nr:hypothetical protein JZ751_027189 [Albula glossodonta]
MRSHKLHSSGKGRFISPTVNLKLRMATMNAIVPDGLGQKRHDLRPCKEISKENATDSLKVNPSKQESRPVLQNGGRAPHSSMLGFISDFTGLDRTLLPLPLPLPVAVSCGAAGDVGPQAQRFRSRRATQSAGPTHTHAHTQSSASVNQAAGDSRHFLENSAPSCPPASRSREECASNPERLDMDRRRLVECPLLDGEERLRLLNLQHNLISRIENLSHLQSLVFLDLYDNRISEMSGISALTSLRVLMLGKNSASTSDKPHYSD